ncbi:MAG: peptidoglycan-binding protein [Oscillospiraceae bacterium]|nr:peptidoglycan-binding protein [Oscillospiraceae bacterium]
MRVLKLGSIGPAVQLLQLALTRAGFGELSLDGIFGTGTDKALRSFQRAQKLYADGIAGNATQRQLMPYFTGFVSHTVSSGDTLFSIAQRYGSKSAAILTANPGLDGDRLVPGAVITVPLPFDVVPTTISCFSALIAYCVRGLQARYPFISVGEAGRSFMGKPLWTMRLGQGENRVLYNASHHANEWICTLLLLKFTEELASAYAGGGLIYGQSAAEIFDYASIFLLPAVNPDGMDLCTGELQWGERYNFALNISQQYPQYSFPSGWKANLQGIDLNLQYPAGWEQARENKFALGITSPAPGDYVGDRPLQASEVIALSDYTRLVDPALVLAYHTQGQVIYWQYLLYQVEGAEQIAGAFAEASGYAAENTPYSSGFAGYKDWFIKNYLRPGFTIEAGKGKNPLPIEQFDKIYEDNLGILTLGALVT